ncbi:hypothetical protein SAMN05421788_104207 [Filimonas lacunae]|uniref:Uncharacterized protein n=1 Tax=Filimonas lacunae TaxID=477680 RepID=A0A1N7PZA5_9BACT|nr:hypothetical protein [Filimonas lacunae]SIT15942.1 hypothetical protein SAMN05421788_104207 [Filimonas lacunae]
MDVILDRLLDDVFQAENNAQGFSLLNEVIDSLKTIVQFHLNAAFDTKTINEEVLQITALLAGNDTGNGDGFRDLKVRLFHLFKNIYLLANGLGAGVYGMNISTPVCYN